MKDIINNLIKKWGLTPAEINSGRCDEFAQDVWDITGGELVATEDVDGDTSTLPGHVWIVVNGRHYDAETPEGVDDFRQLKIFKR